VTDPVGPAGQSAGGDAMRQIARGSALTGAGAVVAAFGGVALTVVVTRNFVPDLAGTFFASTAFFLIVSSLAQLGTDVGLVRFVSAHSATGQQHRLGETLRIALVPVLLTSTALAIAMWFLSPAIADWIGNAKVHDDTVDMLHALTPFLPVAAVYGGLVATTRGRGSMKYTVLVDSILRTIGQPVLILLSVWAGLDAPGAAVAWALPYPVGVVICSVVLFRQARRMSRRGAVPEPEAVEVIEPADEPVDEPVRDVVDEPAAEFSDVHGRALARDFWSFTAARAVASGVVMVWRRFDVLMVAWLASPADAAVYTAATRFLVVGQLGIQAVQMTVSPQFGRLFARNDIDGARRVYKTATMWTMTFAWPLYIITGAAVGLVIPIFGADYTAGAKVTVILSAAMLVATACGGVDAVLLMSGRSWLSLANASITLAVNVGLDLLLIPGYGILGAAIGHATSLALRNLLALYQINRLMGMWAFTGQSLKIAGLSIGCFGVAPAILHLVDAPDVWVVVSLLVGATVYAAWAWTSRRDLQLDTFGNALRRRTRAVPA
jgi:O-antigen/teichoic acid export membrane protein